MDKYKNNLMGIVQKIDEAYSEHFEYILLKTSYFFEDLQNILNFLGVWIVLYTYIILYITIRPSNLLLHFIINAITFLMAGIIIFGDVWLLIGNKREYKMLTFFTDYYLKIRKKAVSDIMMCENRTQFHQGKCILIKEKESH